MFSVHFKFYLGVVLTVFFLYVKVNTLFLLIKLYIFFYKCSIGFMQINACFTQGFVFVFHDCSIFDIKGLCKMLCLQVVLFVIV